jgi:hypothetical protein
MAMVDGYTEAGPVVPDAGTFMGEGFEPLTMFSTHCSVRGAPTGAGLSSVAIVSDQPPLITPWSCAAVSITKRLQVPEAFAPLNTDANVEEPTLTGRL